MNKTVTLVNAWAKFEESHPNASLSDFCRYYMFSESQNNDNFLDGILPPDQPALLTKTLVKIARIYSVYFDIAIKELPLRQSEEFYFLSIIKNLGSPKKTEVIYHTVNELSNGLNIINSLIKQGYVDEQDDQNDKRSKRISLTTAGEVVLLECYKQMKRLTTMFFSELTGDEMAICVQLLTSTEQKFSGKWLLHKNKSFDEIENEMRKS